jgi:hypothetical protein
MTKQEFVLWLTGKPPVKKKLDPNVIRFYEPKYYWEMNVGAGAMVVSINSAPNVFHRAMQRLMLGIRYDRTTTTI